MRLPSSSAATARHPFGELANLLAIPRDYDAEAAARVFLGYDALGLIPSGLRALTSAAVSELAHALALLRRVLALSPGYDPEEALDAVGTYREAGLLVLPLWRIKGAEWRAIARRLDAFRNHWAKAGATDSVSLARIFAALEELRRIASHAEPLDTAEPQVLKKLVRDLSRRHHPESLFPDADRDAEKFDRVRSAWNTIRANGIKSP